MKPTLLIGAFFLSVSNIATAFNNNTMSCTDWPEWTPMYWMQEMIGIDCQENNRLPYYPPYARNMQGYQQSPYLPRSPATSLYSTQAFPSTQGAAWSRLYSPYQRQSSMWNNRAAFPQFSGNNLFPMNNRFTTPMNTGSPFGGMNPMTGSMTPIGSPFGGGMNPMGGSMMPMRSPFSGGMTPMNGSMMPMGSPFGGGMNPMGGSMMPMGSPFGGGMNPMSGGMMPMGMGSPFGGGFGGMPYGTPNLMGGSPFGGASRNPFRGNMMRPLF